MTNTKTEKRILAAQVHRLGLSSQPERVLMTYRPTELRRLLSRAEARQTTGTKEMKDERE